MKDKDTRQGCVSVGLDVGDRYTRVCAMVRQREEAEVIDESRVQTDREGLSRYLARWGRCRVAMETGTHAPWIDEHLRAEGHEVLVLHARKLALVYGGTVKDDRRDARILADLALHRPRWLPVVHHRSRATREDFLLLRAHEQLVRARTQLVNAVRGLVKPFGLRVPSCGTKVFANRAREALPEALYTSLRPVVDTVEDLSGRIRTLERRFDEVIDARYPETRRMMQVAGVGVATALCLRLVVEDPTRFRRARDLGAYLGLTPRRDQSGDHEAQLGITRAGHSMMRRLLVTSAVYILGPFGPDCDLRRWGVQRGERGGPIARKKARVGVARKLAVLLHRLWITGAPYEPLRQAALTMEV